MQGVIRSCREKPVYFPGNKSNRVEDFKKTIQYIFFKKMLTYWGACDRILLVLADVAELADALDSGSSGLMFRGGSSPFIRMRFRSLQTGIFFCPKEDGPAGPAAFM